MNEAGDVTTLLGDARTGQRDASDRLMTVVYDELRRLAESLLRAERPDHTLQATEIVHQAYLRLVDQTRVTWQNRNHFFAVAAQAIRRILVDHARTRGRAKRGAGRIVALTGSAVAALEGEQTDLLQLDRALGRLAVAEPEKARVVELRYFGGLTVDETAEVMGLAPRTVARYWLYARTWLFRELSDA